MTKFDAKTKQRIAEAIAFRKSNPYVKPSTIAAKFIVLLRQFNARCDDTPSLLDAPYMRQATSLLFSFVFFVFSYSPLLTYELCNFRFASKILRTPLKAALAAPSSSFTAQLNQQLSSVKVEVINTVRISLDLVEELREKAEEFLVFQMEVTYFKRSVYEIGSEVLSKVNIAVELRSAVLKVLLSLAYGEDVLYFVRFKNDLPEVVAYERTEALLQVLIIDFGLTVSLKVCGGAKDVVDIKLSEAFSIDRLITKDRDCLLKEAVDYYKNVVVAVYTVLVVLCCKELISFAKAKLRDLFDNNGGLRKLVIEKELCLACLTSVKSLGSHEVF
ncbi:hypothetical protein MBM_06084 [Drepanopeziza brunnea f. sp. 'multigermtubi' MB_m1]|uniref:Uncharacterized protein n=1 Tax=Marssonina brunnea f. sp. multigermtubi (strain MB_m1) TaxID=1072389 RepID=K1X5Y7_MARBU|nr:uncharacterized protein MBM_06084 [Drepanopeziza brunnea f. sp. 'multigermtubi' MB_m1]EKD16073.1 hypothetical protein MBM_06084 [Drepanopeziza brunnea f. sp. 'multigermtubi' MB_m1]